MSDEAPFVIPNDDYDEREPFCRKCASFQIEEKEYEDGTKYSVCEKCGLVQ